MEIFKYCYLYTDYANDTTVFLKDENSIVHFTEKIKLFFDLFGLKPDTTKCEIAGYRWTERASLWYEMY